MQFRVFLGRDAGFHNNKIAASPAAPARPLAAIVAMGTPAFPDELDVADADADAEDAWALPELVALASREEAELATDAAELEAEAPAPEAADEAEAAWDDREDSREDAEALAPEATDDALADAPEAREEALAEAPEAADEALAETPDAPEAPEAAAPPTALKMVEVPTALVIVLPSVVKVEKRVSVETGVLEVPPVPVAEPALAPALVAEGFRLVTPDAEPAGPVAVPAAVRAEVAERVPTLD